MRTSSETTRSCPVQTGASKATPASPGGPSQSLGQKIANGHAYDKHVVQQGEFPGITNRANFANVVDQAIGKAKAAGDVRNLSGGRVAYWDDADGIVVISDPAAADGGTAFKPTAGKAYFLNLK
jgi:filamentous hemagglutinin